MAIGLPSDHYIYRVFGLKVSKSYGLLLRSYPSECNELFIRGLENSPRFIGSSPIGHTCVHYSAIADDPFFTIISLAKIWTPQQMVQGVLRLTEFKSVPRVQRRVRTDGNVDPPTTKSIHQWERI
ncbi:uncharacterized protein TNCV_1640341 [Trichonephila clavipes]|nr:uncharacterized protein TNCV_1640341 [Trichonephila clavipes]